MIKELVMEVTNSLPDTATFDDIIEAIYTRIIYRRITRGDESMVIIWTTPAVS